MLDELCALTGWTRDHARRALRMAAASGETQPARTPRPRIYGEEVAAPLRMIWATLNGPSGKRLAEIVEVLERHGELEVDQGVRDKLLRVSAATIDRLLAPEPTPGSWNASERATAFVGEYPHASASLVPPSLRMRFDHPRSPDRASHPREHRRPPANPRRAFSLAPRRLRRYR